MWSAGSVPFHLQESKCMQTTGQAFLEAAARKQLTYNMGSPGGEKCHGPRHHTEETPPPGWNTEFGEGS